MSKLPFMPFYGQDFYADEAVQLMDVCEQGAYIRLLWHQWREGSIPTDPNALAKIVGCPITDRVLACFGVVRAERRHNPRVEEVRAKHEAFSATQSQRAKSRWDKKKDAGPMPDACRSGNAEPMLSESESEPDKSLSDTKVSGDAGKVTDPEGTPKSDLATVMGAIRTFGYRNGKPPKKGDDARDATVARHLLERHPVESVVRAVEGARLLVETGALGVMLAKNEPYTLRLLNAMWGGKSVFTMALDAYYAGSRDPPAKREHGQPTGIADVLGKMGEA